MFVAPHRQGSLFKFVDVYAAVVENVIAGVEGLVAGQTKVQLDHMYFFIGHRGAD